jgi:hypothetical protein
MSTDISPSVVRAEYTAVVKQDGDWWIGWIEEVSGVNCQERSRKKLLDSLKLALREALGLSTTIEIESSRLSWSGLSRPSSHRYAPPVVERWILGTSPRMTAMACGLQVQWSEAL